MVQTRAQSRAQRGPGREHHPQDVVARRASSRKTSQKPAQEPAQEPPAPKRVRKSGISRVPGDTSNPLPSPPKQDPPVERSSPAAEQAPATAESGPRSFIDFWRREGLWPRQFFEPGMERLYARKKYVLSASGGRKRSNSSAFSSTPSDQRPREEKAAQYRGPRYTVLLETKGVFMREATLEVAAGSIQICHELLHSLQPVPQGTIFDDAVFRRACQKLHNKNEARVIQDLSRLLVPSAETLALYSHSDSHLAMLVESVNEGWNNSVPLAGSRPQPDYAVGFGRDAFTQDQLAKLSPFIGDFLDGDTLSFFMGTYTMYFPFLTCEVKCGAAASEVADRQNAHSTALAVRGVTELFRLLGREDEVNRQILAFSLAHNQAMVKIYGHYPVIEGNDVKYYHYPIKFCFFSMDGEDRWTSYRFVKNVYDIWAPEHLNKIRSAIDQLPLPESEASLNDESTGLSQSLEGLARPAADPALLPGSEHSQSGSSDRTATPTTSVSKPGSAKRKKIPAKTSKEHA